MLAVWNCRAFRVLISSNSRRGTYTGFLRNPPAGVHHENKRKNRGGKMEETDPLACSAWLHHACVLCTVRNNRGNISPPIHPWKIPAIATTMIKSFRFFLPLSYLKRSLFHAYCSSIFLLVFVTSLFGFVLLFDVSFNIGIVPSFILYM